MRHTPILLLSMLAIPTFGQVVINEACSRNQGILTDDEGDHPDWLELHNAGTEPVDLTGYHLSDRLDEPQMWAIPSSIIPPNGYLVHLSGEALDALGFNLSGTGETVYLSDPGGSIVDALVIPALQIDHSFGRTMDGPRVFEVPTPGLPNNTSGHLGYAPAPSLDPPFAFQQVSVAVTAPLPGATIHYTLDGRPPTVSSPTINGPLQIDQPTVVRAMAVAPGLLPSEVITGSYLPGEMRSMPIISIAVDPDTMFHEELGLYMPGPNADPMHPFLGANFWQNKHIPAHFEYFENGVREVSQLVDLRMHGGSSARTRPQRPFRITARKKYGKEMLEHAFFPERPHVDRSKRIILRNSGNDHCLANFRDGLFHHFALHQGLDVDVLAFRPAVAFVNGSYWGIMNMRERADKQYLQQVHAAGEAPVLLEDINESIEGDSLSFHELNGYILANDLNVPASFEEVAGQLDLSSYTDYFVLEMWAGNVDWPANNVRYWRPSADQGKWRYILQDLDATMEMAGFIPPDVDMFQWVLEHWAGSLHSEIFRSLLENDGFRRGFINRFADLMNTAFLPGNFQQEVDAITNTIRTEVPHHFIRWGYSPDIWHLHAEDVIPRFGRTRSGYVRAHIEEHFGLDGQVSLRFEVYPPDAGTVTINTIRPELPFDGIYFDGNAIDLLVEPRAGHVFDHWEFSMEPGGRSEQMAITKNFQGHGTITAVMRQQDDAMHVWPNPVWEEAIISFNSLTMGDAAITVHDANGRLVMERTEPLHEGTNRIRISTTALTSGVFLIRVEHGGRQRLSRLVKLNTPAP